MWLVVRASTDHRTSAGKDLVGIWWGFGGAAHLRLMGDRSTSVDWSHSLSEITLPAGHLCSLLPHLPTGGASLGPQ